MDFSDDLRLYLYSQTHAYEETHHIITKGISQRCVQLELPQNQIFITNFNANNNLKLSTQVRPALVIILGYPSSHFNYYLWPK